MNITFHTNCQGYGLAHFFRNSPDADKFTVRCIQNFRICTGEETREEEKEAVECADILFYHATKRQYPWLPSVKLRPTVRMIPISVLYQGAYFFMENANREIWKPAIEMANTEGIERAADWLVYEADLDYQARWDSDRVHMMKKEDEEGVDLNIQVRWMQNASLVEPLLLTKNHPSSLAFLYWANIILNHIGFRRMDTQWINLCANNLNIVNLPCEDWITTAARKHLGMSHGATDYENRRSVEFARNKLKEWLA